MSLALIYTRRHLTEMLRTPVMFLSISLTPVAVLLFFFVPFVADDPTLMTLASATMVVFAVVLGCLWHFSTTVAATRESPWGAYLRTLPGGLGPEFVASIVTGLAVVAAGVVPIVVVAALFTTATATFGQLGLGFLALLAAVVTFTLIGLMMGYVLSLRAAIIVCSVAILPFAVGGGMFFDPADTPALIQTIAPFMPTRGATDLVLWGLTGTEPRALALVMLGVWTVASAALLVWGYRRDEGRRFA